MTWMQQKRVHLSAIAFFLVFEFIFYYPRVVGTFGIKLPLYFFISLVYALHIWYFNYLIVFLVHRIYPALQHKLTKRLVAFVLILPVSVLLTSLFQSFFFSLLNSRSEGLRFYVHYEDVGMNLLYSLIIIFFLELRNYFVHWSKAVTESAALRQRNMETQLHSLKTQVNPHFLFNSLNSLSSLIQSNPTQAVTFVHKLSGVYRYLLQSNEQNLTSLREELNFLRSYLHLLHTRFGPALQYNIDVDVSVEHYLIPPITLQLLVENAVKHNIVSADQPLYIEVYNEGDQLLVKNNLQKRKTPVASHQVGLRNIFAKYQLLTNATVEIQETESAFVVALPLIKKPVYEGVDH